MPHDLGRSSLNELGPHSRAHAVDLLNRFPGTRVTSARRSLRENVAVGGAPNSYHVRGRAVDFAPPRERWREFLTAARRQRVGPHCTGPEEVIDEGDHIHVAW